MKIFILTILTFSFVMMSCKASTTPDFISKYTDKGVYQMKKMKKRTIYFYRESLFQVKDKFALAKNEVKDFFINKYNFVSFKILKIKRFIKWKSRRMFLTFRFYIYRFPQYVKNLFIGKDDKYARN